ncbi:MAG TPA: multiheme c-type cytochrome [Pirellulales bacterium]|nr:multiheme c-type cytochrome [Pirellulales bacterium]
MRPNGYVTRRCAPFAKLSRWACRLACLATLCAWSAASADEGPAFLGAERCIDCHTQPSPLRKEDGSTARVTLTEAHTWLKIDKHSLAFRSLESDDSKAIGKRLGIGVTRDRRCLSCHAGWSTEMGPPPRADLGVSCEACHGPSSLYDVPHTAPEWRNRTPDEAATGMVDVRNPRRRAEQCLSCHLGNVAEEKVLTHDMYAAGHPPLAGFELESYAQVMPPHWRPSPIARRDELADVKSVVIGGVVGWREAVRLYRDRPATAAGWPDFARYDCSTCHHELERPSWRQERAGRPGQLLAPVWPSVLAELGLRHAARCDGAAVRPLRREVEQGLAALGPAGGGAAAKGLLDRLDELLKILDGCTYDEAAASALLRDICEWGQRRDLDFDSARQLGWAFLVIDRAANGELPEQRRADRLGELRSVLSLRLPATREEEILAPSHQRAMFDAIGAYQPSAVNARFAALADALAP